MKCLYVNIFYILKGIGRFLNKKRCEKLLKDKTEQQKDNTTNTGPTWDLTTHKCRSNMAQDGSKKTKMMTRRRLARERGDEALKTYINQVVKL